MRSQVGVLPKKQSDDSKKDVELVLLSKGSMKNEHRVQILDAAMKTKDMDNEHFLATVRSRLDRCAAYSFLAVLACSPACRLGPGALPASLLHTSVPVHNRALLAA